MSIKADERVARRFARALKQALKARQWTVRQAAAELGVSVSALQELEAAARSPRLDTAAAIARKLGLSLDQVAGL